MCGLSRKRPNKSINREWWQRGPAPGRITYRTSGVSTREGLHLIIVKMFKYTITKCKQDFISLPFIETSGLIPAASTSKGMLSQDREGGAEIYTFPRQGRSSANIPPPQGLGAASTTSVAKRNLVSGPDRSPGSAGSEVYTI